MLRIKGVSKEEATEEVRKIFEDQEKQYGSILNTALIYGLRPTIQRGVQALQAGILASGLIPGAWISVSWTGTGRSSPTPTITVTPARRA